MKTNAIDLSDGSYDEAATERFNLIHRRRFIIDLLVVPLSRETRTIFKFALIGVTALNLMFAAIWALYNYGFI